MPMVEQAIVTAAAFLALIALPLQAQQPHPGSVTASATGPHTVVLKWTAAAGATRYWVQRAAGTANFANLGTPKIKGTTHTDAGAPAGAALRYRVMAGFATGPNSYSTSVSVTTPAEGVASSPSASPPPGQPTTAVAAPPSATGIRLLPVATPVRLAEAPLAADPAPAAQPAAAPAPPAPTPVTGRYRVVANGFTVIHESFDDMLSRDGKYDEVYGGFTVLHFDRKTGEVLDRDLRRTKVLGDINNFPDRLRAGSASAMGGLRAGDSYPDAGHARFRGYGGTEPNSQTFPFKVWEGTLTDGADAAIIMPTMWEQDSDGSPYDAWHQSEVSSASQIWFDAAVQQALKQTSLGVIAPPGSITPNMTPTFGKDALAATGFFAALGQPWVAALFAGSRDRPIGMTSGTVPALPRRAIVLTREIIEHSLNGSRILPDPASLGADNMWMLAYFDVPIGVIPVLLRDGPGHNLQANYVMYLQVERM
jgi:hypothetical protein